jgi:putative PIN family toxin of toxin-antitoxin system
MLRVVPDVNILVSSLINPAGPTGRILAAWRRHGLLFISSEVILAKTDDVLHRPHIRAVFPITELQVQRLLKQLRLRARLTPHQRTLRVIAQDPEDDTILAAAVAGRADCIISGDAHLKDLGRYEGIPILSPADFVARYHIP